MINNYCFAPYPPCHCGRSEAKTRNERLLKQPHYYWNIKNFWYLCGEIHFNFAPLQIYNLIKN